MKRYISSIYALVFIITMTAMAMYPGNVLADSLPGPIQLDLNRPLLGEVDEDKEEDPILEKYNEVMSEITISDEAAAVVDSIKDAVEGVKSFTMDVDIAEIRGQRIERVFVNVQASVEHMVARIEFLEPSAMRGQILVADQENMEVRIYQPVNNQIAVRGLEDASKEVMSTLSVADLNTFFDFSAYFVEVLEVVEEEDVSDYLLQLDTDDEILQVSVKSDTWIPHTISVIEGETPGTMVISNVVLDPDLNVEELTNLPRAKEVRM